MMKVPPRACALLAFAAATGFATGATGFATGADDLPNDSLKRRASASLLNVTMAAADRMIAADFRMVASVIGLQIPQS
jgi:hypothetical protein